MTNTRPGCYEIASWHIGLAIARRAVRSRVAANRPAASWWRRLWAAFVR